MIDPKSLRIGNYFRWSDFASMGRGIDRIESGQQIDNYPDFKEGIPLSEQELIRLGCTNLSKLSGVWETAGEIVFVFNESNQCGLILLGARHVNFHHVHTFQNIIAITGEELTYKSDSGLTPTEPETKELKQ